MTNRAGRCVQLVSHQIRVGRERRW